MKRRLIVPSAAVVIIIIVSGCGSDALSGGSTPSSSAAAQSSTPAQSSAPAQSAPGGGAAVGVGSVALGQILVDAKGRSLYLSSADTGMQSTCSGACAQAWPPLTTTGSPTATSGVMQSLLSTTARADGSVQVTYNGHPLYYFASDTKPGDTMGEGVNGFQLVSPTGGKL